MNGKEIRTAKSCRNLVRQLKKLKEVGAQDPVWKLDDVQVEYLLKRGYKLIPWIYTVKTRMFHRPKELGGLLKDIHYLKVKGVAKVHRKLNGRQLEILQEYGVPCQAYKYRIVLNNH